MCRLNVLGNDEYYKIISIDSMLWYTITLVGDMTGKVHNYDMVKSRRKWNGEDEQFSNWHIFEIGLESRQLSKKEIESWHYLSPSIRQIIKF